jgi:hypothetical protein
LALGLAPTWDGQPLVKVGAGIALGALGSLLIAWGVMIAGFGVCFRR